MSQKNAKRLRRLQEVVEGHGESIVSLTGQIDGHSSSLTVMGDKLEMQDARLSELADGLDGLTARFGDLEEKLEFKERLLSVSYDARKRERKRADGYKADFVFWRRLAIGAVCVAGAVAVIAAATRAKGDTMSPGLQSAPAVVQTVEAVQTTPAAPEENENERIEEVLLSRAHKMENVRITYYDVCRKCCGKDDGVTASGVQAVPYVTCAVDPAVIPFGADVLVDYGDGEIHYYKADDSGVTGNHIDICVSSHSEALQLGVNRATVYWVEG